MKNHRKTLIIATIDLSCLSVACIMAYLFRFDFDLLHKINLNHAGNVFLLTVVAYMSMFFAFRINRIIWRYASIYEMLQLAVSVAAGFIISMLALMATAGLYYVPFSVVPLQAVFYLSILGGTRCVYRLYRSNRTDTVTTKKALIIGAGRASEGLIRDMRHHAERGYKAVGLLDDDRTLHGRVMHGVPVLGSCDQLENFLEQTSIDMVIVAIPSLADSFLLNKVYDLSAKHDVPVRVLPGLDKLADGQVTVDALKKVEIEDLLGREPINLINKSLIQQWHDKIILVTGGGGSIGSELCRQIAINRPKSLCVVDNCEYNLFSIRAELVNKFPSLDIFTYLIDVANNSELKHCLQLIKPHIIFHAAAFKHVPMLESQVFSAVKNNIIATKQLADLAVEFAVERVVMISTDKVVNPTNVMGMSKRWAEIYCQNKNKQANTDFVTVRFGNVLGSTGSVLPLFREQLKQGGPLTVTHPDMTRYFMMIPEAVMLILQSSIFGNGGDILVLDMGKPVKIVELAEKLITLSGKVPYKQVDIQFSGIRPGEKLYEELFYDSEHVNSTDNDKIFVSRSREYKKEEIDLAFVNLNFAYQQRDEFTMIQALLSLVPEYCGKHAIASITNLNTSRNKETALF